MPKPDDPRSRKSASPTAEEEFAALPRWKQSQANKQELQQGWPRDVPYSPNQDPSIRLGHRTTQERPPTSGAPQFGTKATTEIVGKIAQTLMDVLDFKAPQRDPTDVENAWPPTPPRPQEAQHFRDIAQRIAESERAPQLKVRSSTPKKG